MSCGQNQPVQISWTDNGQMIWRVRAKASPGFVDLRGGKSGSEFDCAGQVGVNSARGDRFVKADVLHRGAGQNSAVVAGHEIDALGPEDPLDFGGWAAERNHLAFGGADGSEFLRSVNLRRKTSCGDNREARDDLL